MSSSSGKKRSNVASRYLAAIQCPAADEMLITRVASPQTFPLENDSSSSKQSSSIIQSRSIGNSPCSSSRKSRASRTPPRDSVSSVGRVDVSCNSIPHLTKTAGFFPATTTSGLKHQGEGEVDTDGSSLTNSRSSTPPLHEEDDTLAVERQMKSSYRLQRISGDVDWRARMDGTANYYRTRRSRNTTNYTRSPPPQQQQQQQGRGTTTTTIIRQEEAPTEVMMNLSSIQQQEPLRKSPETMTDVTGTSTEIITNRSVDLHKKVLRQEERHYRNNARNNKTRRRQIWPPPKQRHHLQHSSQKTSSPPPRRKPIEINSLLSDSVTEATEESTGANLYPGSMPMGRLGRHVGEAKLQDNVAQQHEERKASSDDVGSFQDASLTSSVGVETGVFAVPKSEPALKRVFKDTQPDDSIPAQQQQHAKDIALTRPLSPPQQQQEERVASPEEGNYRVPRIGEFPPRAPPSAEKPSSMTSNPFMVRYSARHSPAAERRGLHDIGSPQSNASSDGGWTPVPLSSSGVISEDFVLDPDHTPKDASSSQPVTALFSADRIPSSSKSPFDKLYRHDFNNNEGESNDSVGPPNIHRVTAQQHTLSPPDAPGTVADDPYVQNEVIPGLTPDIHSQVKSPLAVASAPAARSVFKVGSDGNNGNAKRQSTTRSLPLNRARRRALVKGRRRWPPSPQKKVDGEPNVGVESGRDDDIDNAVQDPSTFLGGTQQSVPLSRNLFPPEEELRSDDPVLIARGDAARRDPATGVDARDAHAVSERHVREEDEPDRSGRIEADEVKSPLHATSVRDRVMSFSPPRENSHEYVPPWKSKLKEQASANKETKDSETSARDSEKQVREYIPPWKRKLLMEKSKSSNAVPADELETPKEHGVPEKAAQDFVPPWKRKQTEQKPVTSDGQVVTSEKVTAVETEPIDVKHEQAVVESVQTANESFSPWKLKAMAPKRLDTKGDHVNATESPPSNVPKWKLELMKKKGVISEGKVEGAIVPVNNSLERQLPSEVPKATSEARRLPPKPLFSVRERVDAFSSSKETQQYLPPWVTKAKTPTGAASVNRFQSENAIKSAPPRLSGHDRAVGLSADTNESSFVSGGSSRSKRSFSEAIAEESPSSGPGVEAADITPEKRKRSRVATPLLGAVPAAQVDPSVTSGPSVDDSNNSARKSPQKSFLLAAHLAATADEISPQDRYRQRLRNTDVSTATDGTREVSDVQSLKSFFEASIATGPSDEDDSDDRTVESLRSKFETIPEKEERPSDVSRMRAMFENAKSPGSNKKEFGGNSAVSDAFTKFKPATARWTPATANKDLTRQSSGRGKQSPDDHETNRPSPEKPWSSAPSKVQNARRFNRSPPPKPEDMVRVASGKSSDGSPMVSIAERIRALKLKESPQYGSKVSNEPPQTLPRTGGKGYMQEAAESRSTPKRTNTVANTGGAVKSRDPPSGGKQAPNPSALDNAREVLSKSNRSPRGRGDFPSVKDRVNAFSGRESQEPPIAKTQHSDAGHYPAKTVEPPGRKSWPPDDSGIRSYSDRHSSTRAVDGGDATHEQVQQTLSIPSDEKTGSAKRDTSQISSEGTSGSDYDDGVTLDLSIAEISQLTNPTCIQSKEGGADSSSEASSEASSEHTSDVNRGSNVGSNVEGKHPSEASSSQASEAAAPLIARMKFSDDASNSVSSDKGAFPGRSRTNRGPSRWEPLTPVVDEAEPARLSPDGTHESAWSPGEVAATFPVERTNDNAVAARSKVWQPFQAENNWEASPSFGSNWSPPSNVDTFENPVSEATSFGRLSENTPVRRNTSAARRASPPQTSPSPTTSPAHRSVFSRTHPAQPSTSPVAAATPRTPPPVPATPRPSPVKASTRESAVGGSPSASTGISKHALLMSKLRSLKEARMRRNAAAAGFNRSSVYPSDRQATRPPTGSNARGSPPSSALAPFLRPGFSPSRTGNNSQNRYPDRMPRSSPVTAGTVDDEHSLSTKSSTQFGGNKFLESLELD